MKGSVKGGQDARPPERSPARRPQEVAAPTAVNRRLDALAYLGDMLRMVGEEDTRMLLPRSSSNRVFRMLLLILDIIVMGAVIGVVVKYSLIRLGFPSWTYYVVLLVLALVCYVTGALLGFAFVAKRAPEFYGDEEVLPGVKKWELTAGLGIVPKWVSLIGLASISCLLALLMPVVAPLFR